MNSFSSVAFSVPVSIHIKLFAREPWGYWVPWKRVAIMEHANDVIPEVETSYHVYSDQTLLLRKIHVKYDGHKQYALVVMAYRTCLKKYWNGHFVYANEDNTGSKTFWSPFYGKAHGTVSVCTNFCACIKPRFSARAYQTPTMIIEVTSSVMNIN